MPAARQALDLNCTYLDSREVVAAAQVLDDAAQAVVAAMAALLPQPHRSRGLVKVIRHNQHALTGHLQLRCIR